VPKITARALRERPRYFQNIRLPHLMSFTRCKRRSLKDKIVVAKNYKYTIEKIIDYNL